MTAAEGLPSEATVASKLSGSKADTVPIAQVGQDKTQKDERTDAGSETEMEEKGEAPDHAQVHVHANHVDREVFPTTFDDLCRQMTERANFLLEVMRLLNSLQPLQATRRPSAHPSALGLR